MTPTELLNRKVAITLNDPWALEYAEQQAAKEEVTLEYWIDEFVLLSE